MSQSTYPSERDQLERGAAHAAVRAADAAEQQARAASVAAEAAKAAAQASRDTARWTLLIAAAMLISVVVDIILRVSGI